MKWGMTNLIPPEAVCRANGDIVGRGGDVLRVILVSVESAPSIIGSSTAPATVEWYRVFYWLPDEKTSGETPKAGNAEQGASAAPGSEPGGMPGG